MDTNKSTVYVVLFMTFTGAMEIYPSLWDDLYYETCEYIVDYFINTVAVHIKGATYYCRCRLKLSRRNKATDFPNCTTLLRSCLLELCHQLKNMPINHLKRVKYIAFMYLLNAKNVTICTI